MLLGRRRRILRTMATRVLPVTLVLLFSLHCWHAAGVAESCPAGSGAGGCTENAKPRFRAAVVEYGLPEFDSRKVDSTKYLRSILKEYEVIVKKAKENGADIVVFPEYGLAPPDVLKGASGPTDIYPWLQDIPANEAQWEGDGRFRTEVPRTLSRLARESGVYLVAGVLLREKCRLSEPDCDPELHFKSYNAAVAFDRKGNLQTIYRKYHLYAEETKVFSQTEEPDVAYFETDFGERIGLFICFDIFFEQPWLNLKEAGVTTVAYPTAWIDELPFLTALQAHPGWAASHGVNLLSSNRHVPASGSLGSGVYTAEGIANYTFQATAKRRKIVYADVGGPSILWSDKDPFEAAKSSNDAEVWRLMYEEDLSSYSFKKLEKYQVETEAGIELDKSKCSVKYSMESDGGDGSFVLVSFRGPRPFGGGSHLMGVDVCGVIRCEGTDVDDLSRCGKRPKEGDGVPPAFKTLELIMEHPEGEDPMPVALDGNIQPLDTRTKVKHYREGKTTSSVRAEGKLEDLLSVGLLARVYRMDS